MSYIRYLLIILIYGLLPITSTAASTLVVLGDSLSAAYGINPKHGWVELLQQRITDKGYPLEVINTSISGDTTLGGYRRLGPILEKHQPSIIVIELGANDGLRGLSLTAMKNNISNMIRTSQAAKTHVILIGMKLPPNYGPAYSAAFQHVYTDLAKKYSITLIPFLLNGLETQFNLFQADGLHPTQAAQSIILDTVWPDIYHVIKKPPF